MTTVVLHLLKAGMCRMSEHGEGNVVNIYAQLDSQEMPIPKDLSDYWQDPSSYFLISGDLQSLTPCLLLCSSKPWLHVHQLGDISTATALETHCFGHPRPVLHVPGSPYAQKHWLSYCYDYRPARVFHISVLQRVACSPVAQSVGAAAQRRPCACTANYAPIDSMCGKTA